MGSKTVLHSMSLCSILPTSLVPVCWYSCVHWMIHTLQTASCSIAYVCHKCYIPYIKVMAAVIPVTSIWYGCALTSIFGKPHQRDRHWTATVRQKCSNFFLNPHQSLYMFQLCNGDFVLCIITQKLWNTQRTYLSTDLGSHHWAHPKFTYIWSPVAAQVWKSTTIGLPR